MNPIIIQILDELAITNIMLKHNLRYKDAKLVYEYPDIQVGKPSLEIIH